MRLGALSGCEATLTLRKDGTEVVAVSWTTLQSRDVSERPSESPPANVAYQRGLRSLRNQAVSMTNLLLSHWLKAACGGMGSEERSMAAAGLHPSTSGVGSL